MQVNKHGDLVLWLKHVDVVAPVLDGVVKEMYGPAIPRTGSPDAPKAYPPEIRRVGRCSAGSWTRRRARDRHPAARGRMKAARALAGNALTARTDRSPGQRVAVRYPCRSPDNSVVTAVSPHPK